MGRPKGSKNKIKDNSKIQIMPVQVDITKPVITTKKPKELKVKYKCDICQQNIYCDPIKANINWITGRAIYFRECKIDKLGLCESCSLELNKLIDNWIIQKNKDLKKFS